MTTYNINTLRRAISELEKIMKIDGVRTNQLHKIYTPKAQIPAEYDPKVQAIHSLINKFAKEERR